MALRRRVRVAGLAARVDMGEDGCMMLVAPYLHVNLVHGGMQ